MISVKAIYNSPDQEENTLHRDISVNTPTIIDEGDETGPKLILVELDLVQGLDKSSGRARLRNETMDYMAIGVVNGPVTHIYRHNFLFYVFLWVIIGSWPEGLLRNCKLRCWYIGSYNNIASVQRGHMTTILLPNFHQSLKTIKAKRYSLWYRNTFCKTYGRDKDRNKMYDDVRRSDRYIQ